MEQKTILVGLSGGVDSSVAVLLLKKQGYKVLGVFMKCFSDTKDPYTGQCSYLEEKKMAQRMALHLKIPFIPLDLEKQYKKEVINPMIQGYQKGLTPNPDLACNTIIKFPWLWKAARKYKASEIATGHYARIKKTSKGYQLLQGQDIQKDQSYFLAELTQKDLEHTQFPLGNYTKEQVRAIAKKNHFPNWNKPSTKGICFVGKVNMKSFLEKKIKSKPGKVLSPEGNVLGKHPGIAYYTIGQRIGPHLGIQIEKPQAMSQKKYYLAFKKGNSLIVAPEGHPALKKKQVTLNYLHLINPQDVLPKNLKARIRHLGELQPGKFIKKQGVYNFLFKKPQEALAPGQYLVFYKGSRVIGTGQIQR